MNQQKFNEAFSLLLVFAGVCTVVWFVWHKAGWDWGVLCIGLLMAAVGAMPDRRPPR
jgi:hypothetical protein